MDAIRQRPEPEFDFDLPRGYVDVTGQLHKQGRMRMATALDEIEVFQAPQVQMNEAYLPLVLLSRVITQLGDLPVVTPQVVAGLYAADLAYLEDLYQRINSAEQVVVGAVCPRCSLQFRLRVAPLNEMSG